MTALSACWQPCCKRGRTRDLGSKGGGGGVSSLMQQVGCAGSGLHRIPYIQKFHSGSGEGGDEGGAPGVGVVEEGRCQVCLCQPLLHFLSPLHYPPSQFHSFTLPTHSPSSPLLPSSLLVPLRGGFAFIGLMRLCRGGCVSVLVSPYSHGAAGPINHQRVACLPPPLSPHNPPPPPQAAVPNGKGHLSSSSFFWLRKEWDYSRFQASFLLDMFLSGDFTSNDVHIPFFSFFYTIITCILHILTKSINKKEHGSGVCLGGAECFLCYDVKAVHLSAEPVKPNLVRLYFYCSTFMEAPREKNNKHLERC